ncbi:MAG TPA: class I SAM-dependent methyltransferase [Phenylobacterium sp.]|nr:class I SAM-dependent methyltransferase [Phenylobacterium sp.]
MTLHRNQAQRDAAGATFAEADVAGCYGHRAPYAPELYDVLLAKTPGRRRALDLGCGPGKIARVLADHFDEVVALDPSAAMLEAGRAADAGRHANIVWVQATAEAYESAAGFDLVTAGASIHWPDHAVLFPKLAGWGGLLAVMLAEPARMPCDEAGWLEFLTRWLARMAQRTPGVRRPHDPTAFAAEGRRHEAWMDIAGRERFEHRFDQSVEDFIAGQHSRATWSRAAMGPELAAEFDRELDALVRPFATDGVLTLEIVSDLTWGAPRRSPRA